MQFKWRTFSLESDPIMDRLEKSDLVSDAWSYRKIVGVMSAKQWASFIEAVGDENVKILVSSQKGDRVGGEFMISPLGIERANAYLNAN